MTESESKILGTGWSLVILVIVMYPTSQHYGIQGPSIGFQLRNMTVPQLGNKTKAENKKQKQNKTKIVQTNAATQRWIISRPDWKKNHFGCLRGCQNQLRALLKSLGTIVLRCLKSFREALWFSPPYDAGSRQPLGQL